MQYFECEEFKHEEFGELPIQTYSSRRCDRINFIRNQHLETEMTRRRQCRKDGRKRTLRSTSLARLKTRTGEAECKIEYPDYCVHTWLTTYNSAPYSVILNESCMENLRIDFQATDIEAVYRGISRVSKCAEICICVPHCEPLVSVFDVPVWGGRDTLRFTKTQKDGVDSGFKIGQVNYRRNEKVLKGAGIEKLNPMIRIDALFVPAACANIFRQLLLLTNNAIQMHYEVRAQQYATFEYVARQLRQIPSYTREEYYWLVMNTFFGLEIEEDKKLPAYYVLREFLEGYFCETYALYYNNKCFCAHCSSAALDPISIL